MSLEQIKKQIRLDFPALLERYMIIEKDSNSLENTLVGIDKFAEKVWESALDACRDLPGIPECTEDCFSCWGHAPCEYRIGRDEQRDIDKAAIDSLRTVGDKETV